jgi:uncharacterized MAPEG superfamily protein
MTPELTWVAATALITMLMWVPYILSLVGQMGVPGAIRDPEHDTPLQAPWAQRAKRAHANAVENLVVFAPLAIGVHVAGISSGTTAAACAIYFFARLGHYAVYTAGLPWIRTPLFAIGCVCNVVLAFALLGAG